MYLPIYNSMFVKELEGQNDFRAIKSGPIFVEFSSTLYLEHQIAAIDVLHDKKEPVIGLETRVKRRQKRMVCRKCQNSFFGHCTFNVIVLNNDIFFQDFDGKDFFSVTLFGQHHFAERAFTQHFEETEILQRTLLLTALPVDDFFQGGVGVCFAVWKKSKI